MKKFIEDFEVPTGVMLAVASLICENDLVHQILAVNEDEDIIVLNVEYLKEEREVVHQIKDLIEDHNDEDDEEDEDEDY